MSREIGNGTSALTTSAIPLGEREFQPLVIDYNNSVVPYPADKMLVDLFETQAGKTPNQTALVFEGQWLTYRELDSRATQLAHHLKGLGVGPDVFVGLFVERFADMIVGLLGILKAGGAYVPMDTTFPQERITFMLLDANVTVPAKRN
jgi:non-ribosomal peptide synthetase component F